MTVRLISEDEVLSLLTMEDAISAVESGLRSLALDEGENCPRERCRTDHVMLHLMGSASKALGGAAFKAYTTGRSGSKFLVGLFDGKSGELQALIQGDHLGRIRTGAASGVATKLLARADATTVGIFGTGKQARTQLQAVCSVRPIQKALVYSRSQENRERFAQEMALACAIDVVPVHEALAAADGLDIVVTATSSRDPVLLGRWLKPGCHVNAIGSNFVAKAEIDPEAVMRSDVIVVDNLEQARCEAGDLLPVIADGSLEWSSVVELGNLLIGSAPGRTGPEEISLFKSVGIAIEDLAVAKRVYQLACDNGVGREIDF